MATISELALMASNVYGNSGFVVDPKNVIQIPAGWTSDENDPTMFARDDTTGFLARAYMRTGPGGSTEIAIAYGGTTWETLADWQNGNIPAVLGTSLAPQIEQAARFYLDLRRLNPDATFTFTGHSMGGGLASLMAVYFNQAATIFDAAPFALSADKPGVVDALRSALAAYESDPAYAPLQTYVPGTPSDPLDPFSYSSPSPTRFERQAQVHRVTVRGEALSVLMPGSYPVIAGTQEWLGPDITGDDTWILSAQWVNLHSMTLLNAYLQSPTFRTAAEQRPAILKELFNSPLYQDNALQEINNLWDLLVQRQVRGEASLDHLAADGLRIAQGGLSDDSGVRTALFNTVFVGYYGQGKNRPANVSGAEFVEVFEGFPGGVRFDLSDGSRYPDVPEADRARALLISAVQPYAAASELTNTSWQSAGRWTVQTGQVALNAVSPDDDRLDFVLGGAGNDLVSGQGGADILIGAGGVDTLLGGAGADEIYGGAGDDILTGGTDNDTVRGGAGYDTYNFSFLVGGPARDGNDTFVDSDHRGKIVSQDDGIVLSGGKRAAGQTYYESNDGLFRYQRTGATVLATRANQGGSIAIEGHNNQRRTLGIYLDEDESGPLPGPGGRGNNYNPQSSTVRRIDPLALDLNDDGRIGTINLAESSVYFDLTGDGVAERIGWIDPSDGILARDQNANGYIEGIAEVFGGTTGDGFADLALLDSNADGVIDSSDSAFGSLRAWQDFNRDGISQSGEAKTLGWYGIEAIALANSPVEINDNGNIITAVGTYTQMGQTRLIGDAVLAASLLETNSDPLRSMGGSFLTTANPAIFALPWLRGYGDVPDLHVAYENTPGLPAIAEGLVAGDLSALASGFDTLLYRWSGLEARHQQLGQSRPSGLNSFDRAWIVEAFFGQTALRAQIEAVWQGFQSGVLLHAPYTEARFQEIREHYFVEFLAQTVLDGGGTYYSLGGDKFRLLDGAALQAELAGLLNGATDVQAAAAALKVVEVLERDGLAIDRQALRTLTAGAPLAEIIDAGLNNGFSEISFGKFGNVTGSNGASLLTGGAGADAISGYGGDDVLDGGRGDDRLYGGVGSDRYFFSRGSGKDWIEDGNVYDWYQHTAESDKLRFGPGISPSDVVAYRRDQDLDLVVGSNGDEVTVSAWFYGGGSALNGIERFEFEDGTVWLRADTEARLAIRAATEGADSIAGTAADNVIDGLGGDDKIYGGAGNDTLIGGAGNDQLWGEDGANTLQGGAGNDHLWGSYGVDVLEGGPGDDRLNGAGGGDVFVFRPGDGVDVIDSDRDYLMANVVRFEGGIAPADIVLTRPAAYSLLITVPASNNAITVGGHFYDSPLLRIEFSDGTTWTAGDISSRLSLAPATEGNDYLYGTAAGETISGLGGDDNIYGRDGADFLDGGTGADWLEGEAGDDALFGGAGIDQLLGGDGDDTLAGGPGSDVVSGGNGNDVVVFSRGDGADWDSWTKTVPEDTVRFNVGVAPADVLVLRGAMGYSLKLAGTTDSFSVYATSAGAISIDRVEFADETVWIHAELTARLQIEPATTGNDTLYGLAAADTIAGLAGNDTIYGWTGDDILIGDEGADGLYGEDGNDVLLGGAGNDGLLGGAGDDSYIITIGEGTDWISEQYSTSIGDTVILNGAITPAEVSVTRAATTPRELILGLGSSGQQLRIAVEYWGENSVIEAVRFPDGTVWTDIDLLQRSLVATEGSDSFLTGSRGDDVIHGLGGDDYLYGYRGNDVLAGGIGNDRLSGGAGNDRYEYAIGDGADFVYEESGFDTLRFGTGIVPADVTVTEAGGAFRFSVASGGYVDALSPRYGNDGALIEEIEFADGTIWNIADIWAPFLVPTEGADTLYGSSRNDSIQGLGGNDALYGQSGDDGLDGGADNDQLYGGSGNDTIDGGPGNDQLNGEGGGDRYQFAGDFGQDTITEGPGDPGNVIAFGTGIAETDILPRIQPNGLNQYKLTLTRIGATDQIVVPYWIVNQSFAIGSVEFQGGIGWDTNAVLAKALTGTPAGETITGTHLADTITGLGGSDILSGGAGNDVYVYSLGDGSDAITDDDLTAGNVDTLQFQPGISSADVILRANSGALSVGFRTSSDSIVITEALRNPARAVEVIRFADGTTWDYATMQQRAYQGSELPDIIYGHEASETITGQGANDSISGDAGDDMLDGGDGNDTVRGGDGADVVYGGSGDDYVSGDAGDDLLSGGAGTDTLSGGAGSDVFLYARGDGADTISDTYGYEVIQFDASVAPQDVIIGQRNGGLAISVRGTPDGMAVTASQTIELVRFADGSAVDVSNVSALPIIGTYYDDALVGGVAPDTIYGFEGNDSLNGDAGDDLMVGGLGNDYYTVESPGDTVVELALEGTDTAASYLSYVLPENVERLSLLGSLSIDGTGNSLDNQIFGNSGDNVIDGGIGADVMQGGYGSDTYVVDDPGDIVYESFDYGEIDTILSSVSFVLPASQAVENLILTGTAPLSAAGNGLQNVIHGNDGDNVIDGGFDSDVLYGGLGNDTFVVSTGDTVIEYVNEGIDTIRAQLMAFGSYTLPANVENVVSLSSWLTLTGNGLDNTITGALGNDTLHGLSGDDMLDGGQGADTMVGGAGNDTYVVNDTQDAITELPGEGIDTVLSYTGFTLPANVENLVSGGTGVGVTGNSLDNYIRSVAATGNDTFYGLAGNDVLDGGVGADSLFGGTGDDTYYVDDPGDITPEASNEGDDLVMSLVSFVLGPYVERLTLVGSTNVNGTGNDLANVLTGNDGVNILTGGTGNDSYYVGAGDTVVEGSNAGTDTVFAPVTWTLATNIENLTLAGTADINGTGNTANNTLTGNAGNNRLDGGSGSDTMAGGLGDDTYVVGVSTDVVIENSGEGTDTVESSITYTLPNNVENLTLAGTANRNGTGNALDNRLIGNPGNNTLTGNAGNDYLDGGTGSDTSSSPPERPNSVAPNSGMQAAISASAFSDPGFT